MAEIKREISGFFLSADKFRAHAAALARPDCAITHLRLFHNEPHHTAAILSALSSNASVTSLDIFELDPDAAASLAAILAATPRLTSLAVHHPHGHAAVTALAQGLAANRTLTHLHLAQLDARGVTAVSAALSSWAATRRPHDPSSDAAPGCPPQPGGAGDGSVGEDAGGGGSEGSSARGPCLARLQHLRLERCQVTAEAAAELAQALGGQAGSLGRLEVVDSELGDAAAEALMGAAGWRAVAAASALGCLDLSSCQVGVRGARCLGGFLASNRGLHTLTLANNKNLGCGGASALAAGLAANRGLLRLDLSGCGVGPTGVQALADALGGGGGGDGSNKKATDPTAGVFAAGAPPTTTESAFAVSSVGARDAADRPPLQHLLLGGNTAGAAGLAALLRPLSGPSPCCLRTLHLDHNHIRGADLPQQLLSQQQRPRLGAAEPPPLEAPAAAAAEGADALALPLVTAPLEQLLLAGNALYDGGVRLLADCLSQAPCLEQMDLRENGISEAGVSALLPLLAPTAPLAPPAAAAAEQRRSGSGGAANGGACLAAAAGGAGGGGGGGRSWGLQGLLLDGNRLHNSGGQALLEAVTAAPGLWRFSAEGNKLTDPALRLSLTQISQLRAARHSQLVVLGRHYSSSSSSEDGDGGDGAGGGSRRGSGGGRRDSTGGASGRSGGGAGGGGRSSGGGAGRGASGGGGPAPMDVEGQGDCGGGAAVNGAAQAAAEPTSPSPPPPLPLCQPLKHRLEDSEEAEEGGAGAAGIGGGGAAVRQQPRNVAARGLAVELVDGADGAAGGGGGGGRGGGGGFGASAPVRVPLPMMAGGGGGPLAAAEMCWRSSAPLPPAGARNSSAGGASSPSYSGSSSTGSDPGAATAGQDVTMQDATSAAAAAPARPRAAAAGAPSAPSAAFCGSPPPAMCFVTAITGVGGAGSVRTSKRMSGGSGDAAGAHHVLPCAPAAAAGGDDAPVTPGSAGCGAGAGLLVPQQILPSSRKPRYKPLTPEQQRLFEDF